jgi:hypothetical protein
MPVETRDGQTRRDVPVWTRRHGLAAAFSLAFLSVQIAVAAYQLSAPRPARFGWQMWAARKPSPQFLAVMRDGTKQPADLLKFVGVSRGEMDLEEALPPHLCRFIPGIAAVEVVTRGTESARIHRCP